MPERVLTFVGAGERDISEVKISTGTHAVVPGDIAMRVTYTVSYPGGGGQPNAAQTPEEAARALEESFQAAAEAIIADAQERGVTPGHE